MSERISRRVAAVPPSGIRKFFDIAATMQSVISLGIGEPDFVTPDVVRQAGIDSLQPRGETRYTSNSGILELRKAIVAKWAQLYGVEYDPEAETLITVGGSEALYLVLTAILNPGDEVLIPEPCFVSYEAEVIFAGGTPVPIATQVDTLFQVTGAQLEAAVTPNTKAILINYPNNPTGAILTAEYMAEIAAVAAKHDLLIISDEIYDRLVYAGEHITFSSLPGMRDRTVIIGGFSKDYAMTGWRLGFALGPADILGVMRKIHQYTIMSASTTAQMAAVTALTDQRAEDAVLAMRDSYNVRRKLLLQGLSSIGLPAFEPRGAFYAFPDIRISGMTSDQFAMTLLEEEAVACVPGPAFGLGGEGYVRMCYATAKDKIEEALERMHRFVVRHG